jgi:hypothetical protein
MPVCHPIALLSLKNQHGKSIYLPMTCKIIPEKITYIKGKEDGNIVLRYHQAFGSIYRFFIFAYKNHHMICEKMLSAQFQKGKKMSKCSGSLDACTLFCHWFQLIYY